MADKQPIFEFKNETELGIYDVPIGSTVSIKQSGVLFSLTTKTGLTSLSTVADALLLVGNESYKTDLTGPEGPIGPQGVQGIQGPIGPQGIQGEQGIQGIQGQEGTGVSIEGSDTVTIIIAKPHVSGTMWIATDTGFDDLGTPVNVGDGLVSSSPNWINVGPIKGPQGDQGLQGIQGPQGDAGLDGAQGIQGDTGSQGPQGEPGTAGATGDTGATGQQGFSPYISDGGDSNTDGNWVDLNGDTGISATGPQGEQGTQGDPGIPGPQGDDGLQGNQGDQGPQGIQGIQGEVGPAPTGVLYEDGSIPMNAQYAPIAEKDIATKEYVDGASNTIVAGKSIAVDDTDPTAPIVSVEYDDTVFTTAIDCNLGASFSQTVVANRTFTITNAPVAGKTGIVVLKLTNAGNFSITFPASVAWLSGTLPSFSTVGDDTVTLYTIDGGTTWYGSALVGYSF